MRFGNTLFSMAIVGLTATLVGAGLADTKKDAPTPSVAAKKHGKAPSRAHAKEDQSPPGAPGPGARASDQRDMPGTGPVGMHGRRLADLEAKEQADTLTDKERAKLGKFRQKQEQHRASREARQARLEELHKKEKNSLTDAEKSELDELTATQERFELIEKKHAARAADRAKRQRASKRQVLKAHPWLAKNPRARAEFGKHSQRLARLERAREVAEAAGRHELVARIDSLLTRENSRHRQWLQKNEGTPASRAGHEHASNDMKGKAQ